MYCLLNFVSFHILKRYWIYKENINLKTYIIVFKKELKANKKTNERQTILIYLKPCLRKKFKISTISFFIELNIAFNQH